MVEVEVEEVMVATPETMFLLFIAALLSEVIKLTRMEEEVIEEHHGMAMVTVMVSVVGGVAQLHLHISRLNHSMLYRQGCRRSRS